MSRILWMSNAPWAGSGYGEQTALFLPRLKALGHEVAAVANWGVTAKIDTWNGFTVYPTDGCWGNKSLATYAEHFNADTVIALCDAFVLDPDEWPGDFKAAVWAPVDHHPLPPPVFGVLQHERIIPIAMSRHGEQQMREFDLEPSYVPHGIDTNVFKPMPELRAQAREALAVPEDAFLVGMVAANKAAGELHRKSFDEAFHAFAMFAQNHDDAWLYAHTDDKQTWDLHTVATLVGVPETRLRFPKAEAWHLGIPNGALAVLYQAFDVLLAPSRGEGFGIPLLEAQCSGVPVITSNHSAMVELCHAGWLVDGQPKLSYGARSFQFQPYLHSIVHALELAYEAREDTELRSAAAEFGKSYDANLVTLEHWVPTLERLGCDPPQIESRQVRRARERKQAKQLAST